MKKSILATALIGASFASASASAITVDGITWDENAPLDFTSQQLIFENDVNAVGDVLTAYGSVSAINGTGPDTFLTGASELTYLATFTVTDAGDFDGDGAFEVVFSGGDWNFYADQDAADFNAFDPTTATDGANFLTLNGHATNRDIGGNILNGVLFSDLSSAAFENAGDAGNGNGAFDAVGGDAQIYLDTNTITQVAGQALDGGNADFVFTASFQPSEDDPNFLFGTGELQGDSAVPVPEPATLAMLGLGLMGIRRFARKA